jgi:hypothetical protein
MANLKIQRVDNQVFIYDQEPTEELVRSFSASASLSLVAGNIRIQDENGVAYELLPQAVSTLEIFPDPPYPNNLTTPQLLEQLATLFFSAAPDDASGQIAELILHVEETNQKLQDIKQITEDIRVQAETINQNTNNKLEQIRLNTTPIVKTSKYIQSTNSNNAQVVKSSAGTVTNIVLGSPSNLLAGTAFLNIYDKNTNPNPSADTLLLRKKIPITRGQTVSLDVAGEYVNGIAIAIVQGAADNNNTAVAAGDVFVILTYTV